MPRVPAKFPPKCAAQTGCIACHVWLPDAAKTASLYRMLRFVTFCYVFSSVYLNIAIKYKPLSDNDLGRRCHIALPIGVTSPSCYPICQVL